MVSHSWEATNVFEWIWQRKPMSQIVLAIDLCLLRSVTSKTTWAQKHWHNVAQDLSKKYSIKKEI